MAIEIKSPRAIPLLVMLLQLITLVYKIIEGVIRALIEVAITGALYIVITLCGILMGLIFLRYRPHEPDECYQHQALKSIVVVVSCSIASYFAFTVLKRTIVLRRTSDEHC